MIARFLNKLSNWFSGSRKPDSDQADGSQFFPLGGHIARLSFEKRDFDKDGNPKPRVFNPSPHPVTGVLETSVCGLEGVTEERLWYLGRTLRLKEHKQAIAAVQLPISAANSAGLRCYSDPDLDNNYPEHGVIVGWGEDKEKRLIEAEDLIASIVAVKRPSVSGTVQ